MTCVADTLGRPWQLADDGIRSSAGRWLVTAVAAAIQELHYDYHDTDAAKDNDNNDSDNRHTTAPAIFTTMITTLKAE